MITSSWSYHHWWLTMTELVMILAPPAPPTDKYTWPSLLNINTGTVDECPLFRASGQFRGTFIAGVWNKFIMLLYTMPVISPLVLEPKLPTEQTHCSTLGCKLGLWVLTALQLLLWHWLPCHPHSWCSSGWCLSCAVTPAIHSDRSHSTHLRNLVGHSHPKHRSHWSAHESGHSTRHLSDDQSTANHTMLNALKMELQTSNIMILSHCQWMDMGRTYDAIQDTAPDLFNLCWVLHLIST